MPKIEPVLLTEEALNCLAFWTSHPMYGGTPSEIIIQQMEEWIARDRCEITLDEVKSGEFSGNWEELSKERHHAEDRG